MYAAIWSRLRSTSFSRTLWTWLLIVCVAIRSRCAISLLLIPAAIRSTPPAPASSVAPPEARGSRPVALPGRQSERRARRSAEAGECWRPGPPLGWHEGDRLGWRLSGRSRRRQLARMRRRHPASGAAPSRSPSSRATPGALLDSTAGRPRLAALDPAEPRPAWQPVLVATPPLH